MLVSELLLRTSASTIGVSLLCSVFGTLGYAGAGLVLSRQLSSRARIRSLRDFAWLLGIIAVTPLVVGMLCVGVNVSFGLVEWTSYLQVLLHYWIGDVVGALTLLPLILVLHDRSGRQKLVGILSRWETLLQLGTAAAILALVYVFMPGHNVTV
jgi:integral membrane sensor domain MASE1